MCFLSLRLHGSARSRDSRFEGLPFDPHYFGNPYHQSTWIDSDEDNSKAPFDSSGANRCISLGRNKFCHVREHTSEGKALA